jgi:hypothetical protein
VYHGLVLSASSAYAVAADRIRSAVTPRVNVGLSSWKLVGGIYVACKNS